MLSLLHIENVAVVEQADITFAQGFNVLSGETGAGKSIIIDAIGAILGERTYREAIRTGCDKAFVSAVFCGVPELAWFAQHHVPYSDELLISREIMGDGRNLCRVNGQGVSVSVLRMLGSQLISIHGQHDSQQLFDEERHLSMLDAFACDEDLLSQYRAAYQIVCEKRAALDRLSMDESEKARRQEMLQYQIAELEKAKLRPGEDVELEARQKLLLSAEKLTGSLGEAADSLLGGDDSDGAQELVEQALRQLSAAARLDETASGLYERLNGLYYELADISEALRDYRDGFADSGEELDRIGERLDRLHRLKRKYGASSDEMLAYLEKAKHELDDVVFADERIRLAKKELSAAEAGAEKIALSLREARQEAAKRLEAQITAELAELNMPRVQFLCEFRPVPLGPAGVDALRFLMSANAGEALKPLSKVASGGELARIMLALKNVMARHDAVATMIFDEVDAGVSGRAAQKVAEKLRQVAEGRQVLCVTHLPQIAAFAENHLLISKSERGGRTYTQVDCLDRDGRIRELARMIGGAVITETTYHSAEEMLR